MDQDDIIGLRCFLGWIAAIVGAFLGWKVAELAWQLAHPCGIGNRLLRPEPGWDFFVLAILCAISGGILGLALVRHEEIPKE